MWSDEQVGQWRLWRKAYLEDATSVTYDHDIDQQRPRVQREIVQLLNSFLDGAIALKEFNTIFQQRTHGAWDAFHLRGMSGGLFLNRLVKYVPSKDTFGHLFRLMIRVPEQVQDGQRQMQAFLRFLEGLIASHQVTRAQLQPARVPFFLSACWHVQDPERWPIFYLDARQVILSEKVYTTRSQDPVEVYFAFRTRFLALAQALGLSSWELEHLCRWSLQHPLAPDASCDEKPQTTLTHLSQSSPKHSCVLVRRAEASNRLPSAEQGDGEGIACRTHLQWLLAKIGLKAGCQVWIAGSDHQKACNNERLGNLSLPSLPILADSKFQKVIGKIDVLWLKDHEVIAAYEIEQACTDVSIGLLRLADLKVLFPDCRMSLCLVAPKERFEKVQFELARPAFHSRGMEKHCALLSIELLLEQEEHILRWATSPEVIEELISYENGRKP